MEVWPYQITYSEPTLINAICPELAIQNYERYMRFTRKMEQRLDMKSEQDEKMEVEVDTSGKTKWTDKIKQKNKDNQHIINR